MKRVAILLVVALVALAVWISGRVVDQRLARTPVLLVELRGELDGLDASQYCRAFHDAGVRRVALRVGDGLRMPEPPPDPSVPIEPAPRVTRVILDGRRGANPHVAPESRRANMLGPGYTENDTAIVYVDELRQYMRKHNAVWLRALARAYSVPSGSPGVDGVAPDLDPLSIWRRLVTNTAVHESWHAITKSHSHNPVDIHSVMYANAADNVRLLGTQWLDFTRGHRVRLEQMFGHIDSRSE